LPIPQLRGGEEDTQRLKLSSKVKYVIKEKRIFYHAPAGAEAGVGGEDAGDDDAGRGADSGVDAKVQGDVGASNALATRRQMTASMMMESHVPPPPPREDASSGSKRRLLSISDNYQANRLWDKGYSGQHVKVAIFDTGIDLYHKHFNHVEDR
jgi:subtilisin family serine protease